MLKMLEKMLGDKTNADMAEMFSKGALKLSDEQINTVSFCFWLVYMVETDLNEVIQEAWNIAVANESESMIEAVKKILQNGIRGEKEIDPDNLEYFVDKIKIYESFYGKDNRTILFWKLNTIRNNLFHNRIDILSYNDKNLSELDVKKELAMDYFRTAIEEKDWTQSSLYKSLSEEERKIVESQFNNIKRKL